MYDFEDCTSTIDYLLHASHLRSNLRVKRGKKHRLKNRDL